MTENAGPSHGAPPLLSVVVPAYNEAGRELGQRLRCAYNWFQETGRNLEILVVDDGSDDSTPEQIAALQAELPAVRSIRLPTNRGKGAAVKAGMTASHGSRILMMDADLATPLEEMNRLEAAIEAGADIAIASRGLPTSVLLVRESFLRESCGRLFNWLVRLLLTPDILDTQCGFKLFQGDACREIAAALTEPRCSFDVEMLYLARRAGMNIAEIPVRWEHQPDSRIDLIKDGYLMIAGLARITWRAYTGGYRRSIERLRSVRQRMRNSG